MHILNVGSRRINLFSSEAFLLCCKGFVLVRQNHKRVFSVGDHMQILTQFNVTLFLICAGMFQLKGERWSVLFALMQSCLFTRYKDLLLQTQEEEFLSLQPQPSLANTRPKTLSTAFPGSYHASQATGWLPCFSPLFLFCVCMHSPHPQQYSVEPFTYMVLVSGQTLLDLVFWGVSLQLS